jgi:hypothetical protein
VVVEGVDEVEVEAVRAEAAQAGFSETCTPVDPTVT